MQCGYCGKPIQFIKQTNGPGRERAEARHKGDYDAKQYANVGQMLSKETKRKLAIALELMCEAGEAAEKESEG